MYKEAEQKSNPPWTCRLIVEFFSFNLVSLSLCGTRTHSYYPTPFLNSKPALTLMTARSLLVEHAHVERAHASSGRLDAAGHRRRE